MIRIKAEGTRPILYQWFKDGMKLSDDDNYKGTTNSELFLRNLDAHLKGMYCCRVQDKSQQCKSSNEVQFGKLLLTVNCCRRASSFFLPDPFVTELKREDLREKEIIILIGMFIQ